jgi:two-component system sensor histidine kinase KdpD
VLGMADQLVNVDVSAEDLRERLLAGKIYPAERVDRALENFFTHGNLTRLREFALEEMAHRLDQRRHEHEGTPPPQTSARVMVCLSSRSPNVEQLLRKGGRLADRLNAPWYAVYIQTPKEEITRIDAATQRQINNTLELVQHLGGTPMKFKGTDPVSAIATFAKEYSITHIVLGRSRRPWYRRLFRRSVLERLVEALPEADVLVAGSQ